MTKNQVRMCFIFVLFISPQINIYYPLGCAFTSCRVHHLGTKVHKVQDTDHHLDDLVQKLSSLELGGSTPASPTAAETWVDIALSKEIRGRTKKEREQPSLLIDIKRVFHEKLEQSAINALLSSREEKECSNSKSTSSSCDHASSGTSKQHHPVFPCDEPEHFVSQLIEDADEKSKQHHVISGIYTHEYNAEGKLVKVCLLLKYL